VINFLISLEVSSQNAHFTRFYYYICMKLNLFRIEVTFDIPTKLSVQIISYEPETESCITTAINYKTKQNIYENNLMS
jgi:hypothetical protein